MNAQEFAAALPSCAPAEANLLARGFSADYVREVISRFECPQRPTKTSTSGESGALATLLAEYDLSTTEIGVVRFLTNPTRHGEQLQVGLFELDLLCVDLGNREVVVADHDAPSHRMWRCAASEESFLDALIEAARFFGQHVRDSDDDERLDMVRRCAQAAGGADYLDFFSVLLGAQ